MKREPLASRASALEPRDRFESIDILRGLALYGVLVVNLVIEIRVSIFQQFLPPRDGEWVETLIHTVLEMKAFAVFSLLFGVGLALQYDRFAATGRPRYWLSRRLGVLLGFGLVHLLLIWNGDILTEYALAGMVVLPFLAAPRPLLAVACALLFVVYLALPQLPPLLAFPDVAWIERHIAEADRVLSSGTMADVVRFNVGELPYLLPLHVWVLPRTLGLFLLGALVWRSNLIQRSGELRTPVALVSAACFGLGVLARATPLSDAATVLLALGFAGLVMAALESARLRRAMGGFGSVGRMAFTNYIMQSLVATWIFYGFGLAQFGRLDAAQGVALATAIYAVQLGLSRLWLRHYRFGPLEWLWRTLTYGRMQPMRLGPVAAECSRLR